MKERRPSTGWRPAWVDQASGGASVRVQVGAGHSQLQAPRSSKYRCCHMCYSESCILLLKFCILEMAVYDISCWSRKKIHKWSKIRWLQCVSLAGEGSCVREGVGVTFAYQACLSLRSGTVWILHTTHSRNLSCTGDNGSLHTQGTEGRWQGASVQGPVLCTLLSHPPRFRL